MAKNYNDNIHKMWIAVNNKSIKSFNHILSDEDKLKRHLTFMMYNPGFNWINCFIALDKDDNKCVLKSSDEWLALMLANDVIEGDKVVIKDLDPKLRFMPPVPRYNNENDEIEWYAPSNKMLIDLNNIDNVKEDRFAEFKRNLNPSKKAFVDIGEEGCNFIKYHYNDKYTWYIALAKDIVQMFVSKKSLDIHQDFFVDCLSYCILYSHNGIDKYTLDHKYSTNSYMLDEAVYATLNVVIKQLPSFIYLIYYKALDEIKSLKAQQVISKRKVATVSQRLGEVDVMRKNNLDTSEFFDFEHFMKTQSENPSSENEDYMLEDINAFVEENYDSAFEEVFGGA